MRRLIIAEDEELARRELEITIPWEKWGFILAGTAEDGMQAWELILERKADVVMTDIRMPCLDGIDLMRKADAELDALSRPLFIIVSGHADFEYAQAAVRLGAFAYLIKPVDDIEMEDTIKRALARLEEREHLASLERAATEDMAFGLLRDLTPAKESDAGDTYVAAAISDMRERYLVDLTADSVAGRSGISGDHLSRLIKKATGLTFNEYLTRLRMKRAMELLRDPAVRIAEVADLSGYRDARYFSTLFRKTVGMTPSEFRQGKIQS